ncbi:MAG: YfiR family protein [candidate division Zixibacteria bacterium]|nr:YfiR family protein [candidate division Zixibacteria bacterium]
MKRMILILVIVLLCPAVFGQNNDKDVELSSKFIIDLISKVKWPAESDTESFVIKVVGNNLYVPILQSIADSNNSGDKKIVIKAVSLDDKFENCQIVFIATDDLGNLAKVLNKVEKKSTLTVSMHGTFARYGVMVNIREIKDNEIKYAINKMTARKAKLEIDDDLIKDAVETFG